MQWVLSHMCRPRTFLETGFRPLYPFFVWFVPLSRTIQLLWISTRETDNDWSGVDTSWRARHPPYCMKLFVRKDAPKTRSFHRSFICGTWLIPFVRRVLFTCVAGPIESSVCVEISGCRMHQRCGHPLALSSVGHDSFHLWDMFCSYDTTNLYVWKCCALPGTKDETSSHHSFMSWIWLIPFIGLVWFTCVTWLIELSIRVQISGSSAHPKWRHPMAPLYSGTWLTPSVEHVLSIWRDLFIYLFVWKHWALDAPKMRSGHDSFISGTWLISFVWRDSFTRLYAKDEVVPWLLHMWDVTHWIRGTWISHMRDMTHLYTKNEVVPWLLFKRDVTCFIRGTWHFHMCDMTHGYVYAWKHRTLARRPSLIIDEIVTMTHWLICIPKMRSYNDSFICGTWLISSVGEGSIDEIVISLPYIWDVTHLIRATWIVHTCVMIFGLVDMCGNVHTFLGRVRTQ